MVCMEWKEIPVEGNVKFKVPARLQFIRQIESGAPGKTASFLDPEAKRKLAITKICGAFDNPREGELILNELKLLQSIRHDNVASIVDIFPPDSPDFEDIYLVKDLMETDLHRVIYSKQVLNDEHHQHFSYQILRGLAHLHSVNVAHGELKPSKLLVNKACDVKISDFRFTLSREYGNCSRAVAKPWYAAPETILFSPQFTPLEDVWSAGCILCELLGRKPIFAGKEYLDQTKKILMVIGTPSEADLEWVPEQSPARRFLERVPRSEKQELASLYPHATKGSIDVIEAMLTFSPAKRVQAHGALSLPYYAEFREPEEAAAAEAPVEWPGVQAAPSKRTLQNQMYVECCKFHPEIEDRDRELLHSRGIDVLLRRRRAQQPVVLTVRGRPVGESRNDVLELTFTNLAGNTQASFCINAAKESLMDVRRALEEQVQRPVTLVLPDGALLSSSQDSTMASSILEAAGALSN